MDAWCQTIVPVDLIFHTGLLEKTNRLAKIIHTHDSNILNNICVRDRSLMGGGYKMGKSMVLNFLHPPF